MSDEPGDPKDPDNKLDLDQVQAVALGDVNQIFVQNPQMARLLHVQEAPHRFYLDDFLISPNPLPEPDTAPEGTIDLDAFAHPQLSWIALGGVQISSVKDKILDGPTLQADYRQAPQQIAALIKGVRRGLLTGKKHLTFDVASTKAATLIVQLEENGGGKYNTVIEVPANSQLQNINIDFANLKPADDSKDANNRLDLDQVKQVLVIDVSGILNQTDTNNTLWINKLRAL